MPLSPIAQYRIRNLLRQSTDTLAHVFMPNTKHSNLSNIDLNQVLYRLSYSSQSKGLEIVELELLAKLYQNLEDNHANQTNLVEIKRRIFQILGFHLAGTLSTNLPQVIAIEETEPFRFFYQNRIQNGIRYKDELFGAVKTFALTNRLEAYQTAWALSEAKVPIVLTLCTSKLTIWVNVQSPSYPALLRQNTEVLRTLLFLASTLYRSKLVVDRQPAKQQKLNRDKIR